MTGRERMGWCPSIVTPMAAADGLLVRVKPPAATIPAAAARALGDAARRLGNGIVELTVRGNLQFRGLTAHTARHFAEVAVAHGLAHADGRAEPVRNVAADPLGPDDPAARFDSHALARALENLLAEDAALHALPPKFGFAVDCGMALPLGDAGADVVLRAHGTRIAATPGGARIGVCCSVVDTPTVAGRLARAFLALAGAREPAAFRMRDLVAAVGAKAVLDEAGLTWQEIGAPIVETPAPASGYRPLTRDAGAFLARAGRIDGDMLSALGDLSERFADGTIRMTPWRGVVLAGVAGADAEPLAGSLAGLGFATRSTAPAAAGEDAA